MSEKTSLRELLQAWSAREVRASPHRSGPELAAYLEGSLSADEEAAIQDHLSLCSECMDLLGWLEDALPSTLDHRPLPRRVIDEAWDSLQNAIARPPAKLSGSPEIGLRWVLPLAASVTLAAGLTWWLALGERPAAGPVTKIAFHHLHLPDPAERSFAPSDVVQKVRLSAQAKRLVLVIPMAPSEASSAFRLELKKGREIVWRSEAVEPLDLELTVSFPVTMLDLDAVYEVTIRSEKGGEVGRIVFAFEVTP